MGQLKNTVKKEIVKLLLRILTFVFNIILYTLPLILIILLIYVIISTLIGGGCWKRYSDKDGRGYGYTTVFQSFELKANANYTMASSSTPGPNQGKFVEQSGRYGEWLKTGFYVKTGESLTINIKGEVSLCTAKLPIRNPLNYSYTTNSNKDKDTNQYIVIPRTEDKDSPPLRLWIDAKQPNWQRVTEVFTNDRVYVDLESETFQQNINPCSYDGVPNLSGMNCKVANCAYGSGDQSGNQYHPICGRISIYQGTYIGSCQSVSCNTHPSCGFFDFNCDHGGFLGFGGDYNDEKGSKFVGICNPMPLSYQPNYVAQCSVPSSSSSIFKAICPNHDGLVVEVRNYFNSNCYIDNGKGWKDVSNFCEKIKGDCSNYISNPQFWFNSGVGLLYRYANEAGNKINQADSDYAELPKTLIIPNLSNSGQYGYLEYKIFNPLGENYNDHQGGYFISLRHTKCVRVDGNYFSDTDVVTGKGTIPNRGAVEYLILENDSDNPNTQSIGTPVIIDFQKGKFSKDKMDQTGYIWLKISNYYQDANNNDYQESAGSYTVTMETDRNNGTFLDTILRFVLSPIAEKLQQAGRGVFKQLICYQTSETGTCHNFFTYIRILLNLYVVSYGLMFLVGIVKCTQMDLITRIIKITIVAGITNEKTFILFNTYVFDFILSFSDAIIANISGFAPSKILNFTDVLGLAQSAISDIPNTTTSALPHIDYSKQPDELAADLSLKFSFLDPIMTRMLLNQTFLYQLLSVIGLGIYGIGLFLVVLVSVIMFLITIFRVIAVYIMALLGTALLIGLAPFFLPFMLFEWSWDIFDNWVKAVIKYIMEPIFVLAGIIVLTTLYTMYIDHVLGFSVCFKCTIPVCIPFKTGVTFFDNLLSVPLFCIYWFSPWGYDPFNDNFSLNFTEMVSLFMISYAMYNYVDFAGQICERVTNFVNLPSMLRVATNAVSKEINEQRAKIGEAIEKKTGLESTRHGLSDRGGTTLPGVIDSVTATINKQNANQTAERSKSNTTEGNKND